MTVVAYGLFAIIAIAPEINEWSELRDQYPMESMADRLSYEERPTQLPAAREEHHNGPPNLVRLADIEKRSDDLTKTFDYHRRVGGLERIHAGIVQQFIKARGFGVGRMPVMATPENLNNSNLERINQLIVDLQNAEPPESSDSIFVGSDDPAAAAALNQHEANVLHFANANKFGFVRDREHVAGFLPHEFIDRPAEFRSWKVQKLELVSLLKFDEPAVYISNELPKMKDLKDAKTRPLDSFESQALTALRGGDDLQVQSNPDSIRMLGSIRALKQCIKCHSVERGDLLGAFSYQLRPERK
jgi:hypothetical protein